MDVAAYLTRIDYDGPRTPSLATLRALHRAHLLAVPFENLDIHAGRPIVLDEAAWFAKVVTARRGGFCYELNGLFAALLRALGFDVTLLSACVHGDGGTRGPEYDHLTLLVRVDGRWLADVGFGRSFRAPLSLDQPSEELAQGRAYRARSTGERWCVESRGVDGGEPFTVEYDFSLTPQPLAAFAPMCQFHQRSPSSHFTRNLVCSRATPAGRVTVSGDRLLVTDAHGERESRPIAALDATLRDTFGMLAPPPLIAIRPAQAGDTAAIVELVRVTLVEFGLIFGDGADTDRQLRALPRSYDDAGGRFWVAQRSDGELVGTCGLFPVAPGVFELRKMYLTPAARGARLGQRLLDEAIAFARARGATQIVLDTVEQMARAIAFYEANGFVRDDSQVRAARCSRGYSRTL